MKNFFRWRLPPPIESGMRRRFILQISGGAFTLAF
jgi:hypothetical protein